MMVFALVSCSTEELGNGGNTPASSKGGVQLVLSTDGFNEVGSRAVDKSVIHDVNILQYINGALAPEIVYLDESKADFSKAVEVSGLEEAPATLMDDATDADGNKVKVMQENGIENFVFIVANYGSQIDRTQVPSLAKLKVFAKEFSGKTSMTNLPMTGFYYGGVNPTSTTQMSVTLQRAVAKINFTLDTSSFKVGGETPGQLVVNSIKLCNVPGNITLYPCKVRPSLPKNGVAGKWNFGDQTPFPTKAEMEATGGSVTYGDDQNQSSTANTANTYTYVAYIPENARGSYSTITDNKDKHPSKCESTITDESKDKTYTYILVDLNYAMSDGAGRRATYKIYLGGNSTGDMNLLRNTQYNVTTSLYGANKADTRIDVVTDETTASGTSVLDPANCYMIDMSDVANGSQFIIPLSQVTKGWDKITSSSDYDNSTETLALKTKVEEMLKSGKWEIKTLWKTWEGPTNVTGVIAAGSTAANPLARLRIPASVPNGNNAVIELVSKEDDQVYWSWHLWFTDYKPSRTGNTDVKHGKVHQYPVFATMSSGIYKNRYIMDRNLGATITNVDVTNDLPLTTTTADAFKYFGLMYQFGRKDPFMYANAPSGSTFKEFYDADGNSMPTPVTSAVLGSGSTSFLAKAVMNPSTFYKVSSGNWTKENAGLWSELNGTTEAEKSPFDPCPPGWRVPVNGTWGNFSTSTFPWYANGRRYPYSINAYYPASGYLSYSSGALTYVGSNGYSWSATPNGQGNGFNLSFNAGGVYPSGNSSRAYGFPVRCVQERE